MLMLVEVNMTVTSFQCVNSHLDVALGSKVVDLRGFHLVYDLHQTCAVCQIPIVQFHICRIQTNTLMAVQKHIV